MSLPPSHFQGHSRSLLELSQGDDNYQLVVGVISSVAAVTVFLIMIGFLFCCGYCCIIKYKMCTPIYDPTQHERVYHDDTSTDMMVERQVSTDESQSSRYCINGVLLTEAPPNYNERTNYPFSPTLLPSYENIFPPDYTISNMNRVTEQIHTSTIQNRLTLARRNGKNGSGLTRCNVLVISNHGACNDDFTNTEHELYTVTSYHCQLDNLSDSDSEPSANT